MTERSCGTLSHQGGAETPCDQVLETEITHYDVVLSFTHHLEVLAHVGAKGLDVIVRGAPVERLDELFRWDGGNDPDREGQIRAVLLEPRVAGQDDVIEPWIQGPRQSDRPGEV